jgi:hypothetical protein
LVIGLIPSLAVGSLAHRDRVAFEATAAPFDLRIKDRHSHPAGNS